MYVVSTVYVIEWHSVHTSVCDSPRWARVIEGCKEDLAPEMGVGGLVYHFVKQTTGGGCCCDRVGLPVSGEEGKNVLDNLHWDCEEVWTHRHGIVRVWLGWRRGVEGQVGWVGGR